MRVTCDPVKRAVTLAERGLDLLDAEEVFDGICLEMDDLRTDYGERRVICYGTLRGRLVVVGYTPRGDTRHVFSMRKANAREIARFAPHLGL